jgi:hypothetical protein
MAPALYRQYIRQVLHGAAPFGVPEKALAEAVKTLVGGSFDLSTHRDAVEWNLKEDLIRSHENPDTDAKEWKLTPKGAAKQS